MKHRAQNLKEQADQRIESLKNTSSNSPMSCDGQKNATMHINEMRKAIQDLKSELSQEREILKRIQADLRI